ncbi:FKBP-type peptidyl-prolyl cis-trans isomerase SlyD [Dissulfuribacter thermophilus]|uniref:Peptidyl-prolyl cis-trans isomerase n=1 Tax=Dissulfuribacter thermophilus TaxID=1156395 RepID=A0A1B9F4L4_9BACT|nr:FKBP-type peptidyl-prolyl cis-trans isomerase [Dissulfuribacter thermophilus]OCC14764.1 FKBP-type peptidyl-prolyl cis-trans isomerase SlyD [Dissulfuribacter thermophilus]
MKIGLDTIVKVNISMKVKDGETPDIIKKPSSIEFIYGRDRVHPILEKALLGHEKDDSVQIDVPPEQAFGPYNPDLVNEVPIANLKHPERLKEGEFYHEPSGYGNDIAFTVKEICDDYVVADFNHPAAGKTITLDAKILDVRKASIMEIMAALNAARGAGGG